MRLSNARWRLLALPLLALAAIPLVTACAAEDPTAAIAEARSDRERVTNPAVTPNELAALVEGNTAFARDLYRLLAAEDGNIIYSPYSISAALAMTYAGARGETETEMAAALQYRLDQATLHRAFNALDQNLAALADVQLEPDQKGEPPRLNIANSVWAERTKEFLPEYLHVLAEQYGAGLRLVDFRGDPDGARQLINRWVEKQTEDRIKNLIPEGAIDSLTRLVLTNAIYFQGSWLFPFDEARTADGAFTRLDGSQVTVPMMRLDEQLRYTRGEGFQAVELPYVGQQLAMVLVLPDEGNFADVEATIDPRMLHLDGSRSYQVNLAMPKFEFETQFSLRSQLQALGMNLAFDGGNADFSGMDGLRDLYISDVVHRAFISVDERGTEAAAATAVIIRVVSAPADTVELVLDRPFLFFVRDNTTGTILFAGRVVDPS